MPKFEIKATQKNTALLPYGRGSVYRGNKLPNNFGWTGVGGARTDKPKIEHVGDTTTPLISNNK